MPFKVVADELFRFIDDVHKVNESYMKKEVNKWLETMGFDLLTEIQNEIKRKQVVDTRLLLNSFEKDAKKNYWKLKANNLELTVGTNVEYAKAVNDGHWTNPPGVQTRFVPGIWKNGKFIYKRGANTGMVLKQKWVPGRHYIESAMYIFEKMFEKSLERNIQEWLRTTVLK